MAEPSRKSNNYGLAFAGGFSAMTGIALQVKPEDAVSNLSLWLEFFGVDRVPTFLANTQADTWGTVIGLAFAALSFYIWWKRQNAPIKSGSGILLQGHGLDHVKVSDATPKFETRFFPTQPQKKRSYFDRLINGSWEDAAEKVLKDRLADEEANRQRLIKSENPPSRFYTAGEKERIIETSKIILSRASIAKEDASELFKKFDVRLQSDIDLRIGQEAMETAANMLETTRANIKEEISKSAERKEIEDLVAPLILAFGDEPNSLSAQFRRYGRLMNTLEKECSSQSLVHQALIVPRDAIHSTEQIVFERINKATKNIENFRKC